MRTADLIINYDKISSYGEIHSFCNVKNRFEIIYILSFTRINIGGRKMIIMQKVHQRYSLC